LCGLLLGLDALDVRCGCRECRMDASAGCSNGRGEEHAVGTEIERSVRSGPAWVGRPNFAKSFLVLAKLTPLPSLHMSDDHFTVDGTLIEAWLFD